MHGCRSNVIIIVTYTVFDKKKKWVIFYFVGKKNLYKYYIFSQEREPVNVVDTLTLKPVAVDVTVNWRWLVKIRIQARWIRFAICIGEVWQKEIGLSMAESVISPSSILQEIEDIWFFSVRSNFIWPNFISHDWKYRFLVFMSEIKFDLTLKKKKKKKIKFSFSFMLLFSIIKLLHS